MNLLIHDLSREEAGQLGLDQFSGTVISDDGSIRPCAGCFGCWVKTPGACVIRDRYGDMGKLLAGCETLFIVSRCVYGGFSPFVKNVLDRSIPYLHPYFVIRNGEMHHRMRHGNTLTIRIWFYGTDLTAREEATARKLVTANAVNLNGHVAGLSFAVSPQMIGGLEP